MDSEKTGKLIQELRKEKELTQMSLADMLGVTDRAVSKWERGKSFPDVSMLKPLSEALDVSVIELLDGERLTPDEMRKFPDGAAALTVEEADETAMKGIRTYIHETLRKERIWKAAFAAAVLVLIFTAGRVGQMHHSPVNFQESPLNFRGIRVVMEDGSTQTISLDDPLGEELKRQIQDVLRKKMPEAKVMKKLAGLPEKSESGAYVELKGLITLYKGAYYDQRSREYDTFPYIEQIYQMIYGMCSDRLADGDYHYEGKTHFTCDGRNLNLECELTEQPMELIVDYFLEAMRDGQKERYLFDRDVEDYTIKNIVRMCPEEYDALLEFQGTAGKEIPYCGLYDYRVYRVTFEFTRKPGTGPGYQVPGGTYDYLFMAAKGYREDEAYHIYPEYVSMLFPQT